MNQILRKYLANTRFGQHTFLLKLATKQVGGSTGKNSVAIDTLEPCMKSLLLKKQRKIIAQGELTGLILFVKARQSKLMLFVAQESSQQKRKGE